MKNKMSEQNTEPGEHLELKITKHDENNIFNKV
jgi:hypothetical protein